MESFKKNAPFDAFRHSSRQAAQGKFSTKNLKWYLLGILFFANVFIWQAIFAETRDNVLTVAFLDIGQGDAIFIEAPNGNQVLIDGGSNQAVLGALSEIMEPYDRTIDIIVATHPDKDHIGGLVDVLRRYDISRVIDSGLSSDTGVYQEFEKSVAHEVEEGAERLVARRGMSLALGSGINLFILSPESVSAGMPSNDASIVSKLTYGAISFLLTGDAAMKVENRLVFLGGALLKSDVLKVGHHGSKFSTSALFLAHVLPVYSVISSGQGNPYGHPSKEALGRLEEAGANILRTDLSGSIVFLSDGESIFLK